MNPQSFKGSGHGLTEESEASITWIHRIPWQVKPAIPGLFNLFNSTLRWAALIYVPASIAEMIISGLELSLSVVAARIIRKRMVSCSRWSGVAIVVVGLIFIGLADMLSKGEKASSTETTNSNDRAIGIMLVIGQSILSVLQDMAEELFMQAADFPPTLLLGMEGIFGLVFGIILYVALGPIFGERPTETLQLLQETPSMIGYATGLVLLFTITGIFNIKATEVTSSMTRNVWKNLRTVLVWIVALMIFYVGGNSELGEEWLIPESFFILIGFLVMVAGILLYYSQKGKEEDGLQSEDFGSTPASESTDETPEQNSDQA